MTRCPATPAVPDDATSLFARPTLPTLALQWPALNVPCHNRHDTPMPAVLTGTNLDGAVSLCVPCACADDWFVVADGRELPSQVELLRAMDALEAVDFDGDVVGWPRPVWTRPEPSGCTRHSAEPHAEDDEPEGPSRLPVPWINGAAGLKGDFFSFRDDALRSVEQRLCAVCGDQMAGDIALGALNGTRVTSGGWCHPRCLAVAVRMCPHFPRTNAVVVAWRYRGPGVGLVDVELVEDPVAPCAVPLTLVELTAWAQRDPWGEEGRGQQGACGCPPATGLDA